MKLMNKNNEKTNDFKLKNKQYITTDSYHLSRKSHMAIY